VRPSAELPPANRRTIGLRLEIVLQRTQILQVNFGAIAEGDRGANAKPPLALIT
jgi:hypothetical protein